MPRIRDTVTLHPETVAEGESLAKEKRKRAPKEPEPPVTKRYSKRPDFLDEKIWDTAMALADGNVRRIVVESPKSVLVVNKG